MKVSAQQAADILGVSRTQISRLVANGDLHSDRFGQALQIDLDSVRRYQDLRPSRGRPLPAESAWQKLLVSDLDNGDLSELKRMAIMCRRRAVRHLMRVMPGRISRVLGDDAVVVSGAGAAAHAGKAVQDRAPHSIYVRLSDFHDLRRRHRLSDTAENPNLIVRVAPDDAWVFQRRWAAPLVAALDLVDDRDDRAAAEAIR